jgi:hypothetical protein
VVIAEVPTLGDVGKLLFAGLLGAGGLLLLRRRRGLAAPVVALTLALGGLDAAEAARPAKEIRDSAIQRTEVTTATATLHLADGSTVSVPLGAIEIKDRRQRQAGRPTPPLGQIPAGQPVLIKIKHGADGSVRGVKLQLFDTPQAAQAALREHDRN